MPFTYQWSYECSGDCYVEGQTSKVASVRALRLRNAGRYTCVVTDAAGFVRNGSVSINLKGESCMCSCK